jgi:hypothetical protein
VEGTGDRRDLAQQKFTLRGKLGEELRRRVEGRREAVAAGWASEVEADLRLRVAAPQRLVERAGQRRRDVLHRPGATVVACQIEHAVPQQCRRRIGRGQGGKLIGPGHAAQHRPPGRAVGLGRHLEARTRILVGGEQQVARAQVQVEPLAAARAVHHRLDPLAKGGAAQVQQQRLAVADAEVLGLDPAAWRVVEAGVEQRGGRGRARHARRRSLLHHQLLRPGQRPQRHRARHLRGAVRGDADRQRDVQAGRHRFSSAAADRDAASASLAAR